MSQEAIAKELYEALRSIVGEELLGDTYAHSLHDNFLMCVNWRDRKQAISAIAAYEASITEPLEE